MAGKVWIRVADCISNQIFLGHHEDGLKFINKVWENKNNTYISLIVINLAVILF